MAAVTFAAALLTGVGVVAATGPATLSEDPIVLYSAEGGDGQNFRLRNGDGDRATVSVVKDVLTNGNGKVIGAHHWQCVASDLAWYCTGVIALNNEAPTGQGTITFAGLFKGFNGESLAVTGGTGAYAGAEGTIVLKIQDDQLARVVKLI
jgi:hypothetical protein